MLLVTICALNDEVLAKTFKKYKKCLSLNGCLVLASEMHELLRHKITMEWAIYCTWFDKTMTLQCCLKKDIKDTGKERENNEDFSNPLHVQKDIIAKFTYV